MVDLVEGILQYVAEHGACDSLQLARVMDVDHQKVVGTIKSIQAFGNVLQVEQQSGEHWELTAEGSEVCQQGSPEGRLVRLLGPEGLPRASLSRGDQLGLSKALALGWVLLDKEHGTVRLSCTEPPPDLVQASLCQVRSGHAHLLDDAQRQELKRRKLLRQVVVKSYRVQRGENFATQLSKPETDLTAEMLASGQWRQRPFKAYNFAALGQPTEGGHLHPLLQEKKQHPVKYTANRKAWMTREIFTKWGFVNGMRSWQRRIARCALFWITVPPTTLLLRSIASNCTAKIQSLDQGVIMSLKVRSEVRQVFLQMGFTEMSTARYVENAFWNFDALFQPQQHPARDAHDTFFLKESRQAMSHKRKALSFKEKLDTLRKVDEDPKRKRTELAKKLGLATSTLSTIVGQRDTIKKNVLSFSVNPKRAKTAQHVKLEESLLIWFKEVTAAGVNIDGKVLREKADEIALALHIDVFLATEWWLHRFKTRHCLVYKSICGEAKQADETVVSDWLAKLESLISWIPEELPEALSESEEPIEGWECLDAGCSADDLCTADDNFATCGARTVEDIVNEVTCEVADSSDDDKEMDECDGEGPPPADETLHALGVLRHAMAAEGINDDMCTLFYGFQKSLLKPRECQRLPQSSYVEAVKLVHSVGGHGSQGYQSPWLESEARKNLLRTHTTAVSARMLYALAQRQPFTPCKLFSIDRVFRNETLDATHLAEFCQVEGLVADRGLTLGHLQALIGGFFAQLGMERVRFKPAYNPYTEPSMEIFAFHPGLDRWVEVGNSGLFRPEMLQPMGLPQDVRCIAWGLSLER
ncbi:hypothetical protein HPB51_004350 [Rhipicephalus microplus]|uniref:phenylalanine--tRNA ligase n=1 Tax=Rhipicephalus microplus TaxID=6941 RepID=A0A9J6ELW5_RHIMP|nr:hypothetical protein HPB51_004350 [Rhipicephalus microplus]